MASTLLRRTATRGDTSARVVITATPTRLLEYLPNSNKRCQLYLKGSDIASVASTDPESVVRVIVASCPSQTHKSARAIGETVSGAVGLDLNQA